MVSTWTLKRDHVTVNGVLMLALGTALFTTEPMLTNPSLETLGYQIDVVLTALCLLASCIHLGLLARRSSRRQVGIYLLFTELLVAGWLLLWIARSTPLDLRALVVLAGWHGVFWGMWLVKLASQLRSYPIRAASISIFAAITSALGLIIATQASLTRLTAVTLVSCYTLYIGVSIVTMDLMFYRALEGAEAVPPASKSAKTGPQTVLSTTSA